MQTSRFILFAGGTKWRLAVCDGSNIRWHDLPPLEQRQEQVAALWDALKEFDYDRQRLLIALCAERCISATLRVDDLPANDRKALLYRMEAQLPIEAEQIVADFVAAGRSSESRHTLAVATERAWLTELLERVQAFGIVVGPVVPTALLSAAHFVADNPTGFWLFDEPESSPARVNLLAAQEGRPIRWVTIEAVPSEFDFHADLLEIDGVETHSIQAATCRRELLDHLSATANREVNPLKHDCVEAAVFEASLILAGEHKPWINLRIGPAASGERLQPFRPALNALLGALLLLFASLSVVAWVRAARYSAIADANQQAMMTLFHATFPGWATPFNYRAVVESEHRKLGTVSSSADGSAFKILQDVLLNLPVSPAWSLQRMNFTSSRFEISGQISKFEVANTLASALRAAHLSVAPPQARRLADGQWSFTLQGGTEHSP